jgi:hypothetical protein
MRVRIVEAFELVLVAMVVAACNGGDQPSTLPDATSATATVPTTESAAHTPTGDPTAQLEAEITEFYKLYVETINESWTSEEALQRRREMFADTCGECLAGYEFARRAHTNSLTLEGGDAHVTDVRIDAVNGNVVTFLTFSDVPAARLVNTQGDMVMQFDEGQDTQTAYQAQRTESGRWIIISGQTLS